MQERNYNNKYFNPNYHLFLINRIINEIIAATSVIIPTVIRIEAPGQCINLKSEPTILKLYQSGIK